MLSSEPSWTRSQRAAVTTRPPCSNSLNFLEAAVAVGHRPAASVLMARLDCVAHLSMVPVFQMCVGRHLGDAAVLVGDPDGGAPLLRAALREPARLAFVPNLP